MGQVNGPIQWAQSMGRVAVKSCVKGRPLEGCRVEENWAEENWLE